MPLKYTGRAKVLDFEGTKYAHPDYFVKGEHDYTFDTPIKGLTKERALSMMDRTNIHNFEDTTDGADLLEKVTAPTPAPKGDSK